MRWNPGRREFLVGTSVAAAGWLAGCAARRPGGGTASQEPASAAMPANRAASIARSPALGQPGPHPVAVHDHDWIDNGRDRPVPVRLYAPQATTVTLPLILFSHGLGGSRYGYSHLGRFWASHGFVSIHLQHAGSDRGVWGSRGLSMLGALRSAANVDNAVARVLDVRFALDTLLGDRDWSGRIDRRRIGIAGHSFGANTAILASGARFRDGDAVRTFGDPRISAAVLMSPPALPADQDPYFVYSAVGLPTLHLTGTRDETMIPGLTTLADERRVPFDSMAALPRYLGVFDAGRHSMFADWSRDETSAQIKAAARDLTLAFWRSVFDSDREASARLANAGASGSPHAASLAFWESRVPLPSNAAG